MGTDVRFVVIELQDGALATSPSIGLFGVEPDIEVVKPPIALDPVLTKHRFMSAIGAPRYIPALFGGGRLERD